MELVTNGREMLFIRRGCMPPAYRPKGLGPNQIAYLRARQWIDRRTVTRLPAPADVRVAL